MESPRPSHWHRLEQSRRALLQRMLLAGAGVGIAVGLVGQVAVGNSYSGDIEWIVRLALVLPGIVFIAWWLAFPSVRPIDSNTVAAPVEPRAAVDQRLERIEASFDSAAVPAARRRAIEPGTAAGATAYEATIRRADASSAKDLERFAVRRASSSAASEQPRTVDHG